MQMHNVSHVSPIGVGGMLRFVLAASSQFSESYVYRGDFSTHDKALLALGSDHTPSRLDVVCASIWRAPNGNIRLWKHGRVRVTVELVDPCEGVIGGDDIEMVWATLDLGSGALELDAPQRGYPLLQWADTGATVHFEGQSYHAFIKSDNLPPAQECWGLDVVQFIAQHGYHATLDLTTLHHAGDIAPEAV